MSDLSAYGLPIPSANGRRTSELLSITDRLSRALDDFDSMYDNEDDDAMLTELSDKVNDLESGELKFQMKGFITKYKEINTNLDNVSSEREEILGSLADWFQMASLDMDIAGGENVDDAHLQDSEKGLKNSLTSTKMNFDKLKRLKEEIDNSGHIGRDVGHLKVEKEELEKAVISNFRDYNDRKKSVAAENTAAVNNADVNKAWGHAAAEICGMLKNVRESGADYLEELEKKVNSLSRNCDQMSYELNKVKRELEFKKSLEKKWEDDNLDLTSQKAKMAQKLQKYKKELIETRKRLNHHEPLSKLGRSILETDEEIKSTNVPPNMPAARDTNGGQNQVLLSMQLKDAKNTITNMGRTNEELQETICNLNMQLEEKEEDIMMLQHDKSELLHQMKMSSVRPDVKQLSNAMIAQPSAKLAQLSSRSLARGSFAGIKVASESLVSHRCQCNCHEGSPSGSKGALAVSPVSSGPIKSTSSKLQEPTNEESYKKLREQLKSMESKYVTCCGELEILTTNLEDANSTMHTLKQENNRLEEEIEQIQISRQDNIRESAAEQTENGLNSASAGSEHPDNNHRTEQTEPGQAAERNAPNTSVPPHKCVETVIEKVITKTVYITEKTSARGDVVQTSDTAMQTDPAMDPISAWATVPAGPASKGWKPPLPPANWVEFDPTPVKQADVSPSRKESVALQMMKGAEPLEIRDQTVRCVDFIEKEVERMLQGIFSFTGYINTIIDQDAKMMSMANAELRSALSPDELADLRKELVRPPSAGLRGSEMNLDQFPSFGRQSSGSAGQDVFTGDKELKDKVEDISQKVIQALKQTAKLLYDSLHSQHRQYQQIYDTIQKNPREVSMSDGMKQILQPPKPEEPHKPKPKRSFSHDSLIRLIRVKEDDEDSEKDDPLPQHTKSKSMTEIRNAREILGTLQRELDQTTYLDNQPFAYIDKSVAKNKERMNVAAATVPRKGMIKLVVANNNDDFGLPQDVEFHRRKYKPAPMSHKKLMAKQKDLVNRKQTPDRSGARKVNIMLENKSDEYGGFSLGELERKADEFVENAVHQNRRESLAQASDRVNFPKLNQAPGENAAADSTSPRQPNTKFPALW